MEPVSPRAKEVKELLNKFTLCEQVVFECSDISLQSARFEEISPLDIMPSAAGVSCDARTSSLLRLRAMLNIRIKIAEQMRQGLKNKIREQFDNQ